MKKQETRVRSTPDKWIVLYLAGLALAIILLILRLTRRFKIYGLENLPKDPSRQLWTPNHPSMLEPLVLAGLFARWYLLDIRTAPWSTPDKSNFFDKEIWAWARLRCIPVDRSSDRGKLRAMRDVAKVLNKRQSAILFPEAGRTSSIEADEVLHTTKNGRKIRALKLGLGRVMVEAKPVVIPIWVEGSDQVLPRGCWFPRFWRKMSVRIGEPIDCSALFQVDMDRAQERNAWRTATELVTAKLLELAEQEEGPFPTVALLPKRDAAA